MGHQLAGSTIGVLGYGRLGKIFCEQLTGFRTNILVCDNSDSIEVPSKYNRVDIDTLFASSLLLFSHPLHKGKQNLLIDSCSLKPRKDFI